MFYLNWFKIYNVYIHVENSTMILLKDDFLKLSYEEDACIKTLCLEKTSVLMCLVLLIKYIFIYYFGLFDVFTIKSFFFFVSQSSICVYFLVINYIDGVKDNWFYQ